MGEWIELGVLFTAAADMLRIGKGGECDDLDSPRIEEAVGGVIETHD